MKKSLGFLLSPVFFLAWLLLLNIFHVLQIVALKGFGQRAHQRTVDALNFFLLHSLWLLGTRINVRFSQLVFTPLFTQVCLQNRTQ